MFAAARVGNYLLRAGDSEESGRKLDENLVEHQHVIWNRITYSWIEPKRLSAARHSAQPLADGVAPVAVVGMDVGDLLGRGPCLRRSYCAGHAVGQLNVRACRQLSHRTTQTSRTPARNVLASLSKRVAIAL